MKLKKIIWTATSVLNDNVHTETFRDEIWFLRYLAECQACGGKIIYAAVVDIDANGASFNHTVLKKYMSEI